MPLPALDRLHREHSVLTSLLSRKAIPSYPYTPPETGHCTITNRRRKNRTVSLSFMYNNCNTLIYYPVVAGSSSTMTTSVHASKARFQSWFEPVSVALSPTMINASRVRVHITFSRLRSSRNPTSPSTLNCTVEKMKISLSRPWNESTR